jgi:CheY-specific phosphatase CheX
VLKLLFFAIVITCLFIFLGKYKTMDPSQKKAALWRAGVMAFIGILALLVITGKMHWIGAAIGALIPFLRNAYGLVAQVLPLWLANRKKDTPTQDNSQAPQAPMPQMPIDEAVHILGLSGSLEKGEITAAMVQDAHRKLIQKLHPDRGGNDYLAAKINQARDLLLERVG